MKTLLVMRHAKSSWADESMDDFDRPLNKRGERDAPKIGRKLLDVNCVPDLIVCSKAVRASSTAQLVADTAEYKTRIQFRDRFYHASPADYMRELTLIPASKNRVMVVGHNPGLERLIEHLTGQFEVMPTAAVAFIQCPITDWETLDHVSCDLLDVWRPKEVFASE